MNNSNTSNKYFVWTALAVACVLVDVGFFMVLGSIMKWLAALASPLVWSSVAVVALIAARFARLFDGARLLGRQQPTRS